MYQTKSYLINDVKKITVHDFNTVVRLLQSPDSKIYINLYDEDGESYSTSLNSGILEIKKKVKWHRHILNWGRETKELILKVPENDLLDIEIKTKNKNIYIEKGVTGNLNLLTNNSNVDIYDCKANSIFVKTNNGPIRIMNVISQSDITLKTFNAYINAEKILFDGEMRCKTSNASIDCTVYGIPDDFQVRAKTMNANVQIPDDCKYGDKKMDLKTSNGTVTVKFC
ncbi:putative adhesin [Kineothrix alysoides]|uniref:Putative adhesin n=1 Tax=Kineothrix alysoides TaxID=1469948 RepID=A0A4R1QUI7_9FIRM|nr:DUF4097 family beta strand repeat-containing protein [Kineothrix alysoides]TCL57588.1 putative adhesin [Kineothrix alysoides]